MDSRVDYAQQLAEQEKTDLFGSAVGDSVVGALTTLTPAQRWLLPDRERTRAVPESSLAPIALVTEDELPGDSRWSQECMPGASRARSSQWAG